MSPHLYVYVMGTLHHQIEGDSVISLLLMRGPDQIG